MKKIMAHLQVFAMVAVVMLASVSSAFATAWTGYSDIATGISGELTAGLAVVAALLAITIGVPLGVRLLRRLVK